MSSLMSLGAADDACLSLACLLVRVPVAMLVIAAAYTDYRARKIPNIIPILLVVLFGITFLIDLTDLGKAQIISMGIALSLGIGLFFGGFWGGGDAKLLTAISIYLDPAQLARLFLVACLFGGLLALGLLIRWRYSPKISSDSPPTVPFGIAIAVGTLEWALYPLLLH